MNIKPQQCITMATLGRFAKGKGAHNAFVTGEIILNFNYRL